MESLHQHIQEDIVLEPRVVVTRFVHQQAHCEDCDRDIHATGPGELPGSYIGPAAKATAIYLRYELNLSERKISRFFADFFGLKFVPASAYGFERQVVRRGWPLYADLLEKVCSLAVAHADETSWRHDGGTYWVWYAGNDDLALFRIDAHRSTPAAQELLGERFGGVLVADAYASYKGIHPKDRQSCLAHIKTKAKELGQELALLRAAPPILPPAGSARTFNGLFATPAGLTANSPGGLGEPEPPKPRHAPCARNSRESAGPPFAIREPKPSANDSWVRNRNSSSPAFVVPMSLRPIIRPSEVCARW